MRDDENQICQNCGERGHRKYDCPEQRNFNAGIVCRLCGSAGHMARDCTTKRDPNGFTQPGMNGGSPGAVGGPGGPGGFDSEYASLMAELGEGARARTGGGDTVATPVVGGTIGPNGQKIPPWRLPEMWNPPGGLRSGAGAPAGVGGGYPGYGGAPQGYQGYGGAYGAQGYAGYNPQAYGQQQSPPQYGQQGYDQQAAYAQYYQSLQATQTAR